VTLDDIWAAISGSPYLALLGCRVLPDRGTRGIELNHIPEVADGTVRTVSREAYERGLPDDTPLRFASYGDPAFEAILGLVKASGIPPAYVGSPSPFQGSMMPNWSATWPCVG
jgi:hypothetical protein